MAGRLPFNVNKLQRGPDGWLYYDGVYVGRDEDTFINNAHNLFPPLTSGDAPPYAVGPFPPDANRKPPLTKPRLHHEESSSDEEGQNTTWNPPKSPTMVPVRQRRGGSKPSPFIKALDTAADVLAETTLDRVSATDTWRVRQTPGKLMAEQRWRPDGFFETLAKDEENIRKGPPSAGKRKRLGLAADEIVATGALQCAGPCRAPDLNVSLLKIFRPENFNDTPADVYEAIQPALKLATKLMTDRRMISFWATVAGGEREFDPTYTGSFYSMDPDHSVPFRLPRRVHVTPEIMNTTLRYLDRLGDHVNFSWNDLEAGEGNVMFGAKVDREHGLWRAHNHGMSGHSLERDGLDLGKWPSSRSRDRWEYESVIWLSRDFFTVAKKIAALRHPDTAMSLRFYFLFATTICHEVAHAFEGKAGAVWFDDVLKTSGVVDLSDPNWIYRRTERALEAIWLQENVSEMGQAWERDTFGGRIWPVNSLVDGKMGVLVLDGQYEIGENRELLNAGIPQGHLVPMAFMEEIQQQSFWDRRSDLAEPHKILHIPRTGAVADFWLAAYATPWRTWLQQRDAAREEEQAKASGTLEADGDTAGPSKRIKLSTPDPKEQTRRPLPGPGSLPPRIFLDPMSRRYISPRGYRPLRSAPRHPPRGAHLPPRGSVFRSQHNRLQLQPRIDKVISRDEQNTAMLRAEAMATLAAEKAAAAEQLRQSQQFGAPEPGQSDLFDHLQPQGSDSDPGNSSSDSDPDKDPALKPPHKLTVADKWLLLEEEARMRFGLTHSSEFLAMRTLDNLAWVPWDKHPSNPASWSQDQLTLLLSSRILFPGGNAMRDEREQRRAKQAEDRRLMVLWAEMEELAVLAGLSRIEFHRLRVARQSLPLGMDPLTWETDPKWRELLRNMRATDAWMRTPEYQHALQTGQVNPGVQEAAAAAAAVIQSRLRSSKQQQGGSELQGDNGDRELTGDGPPNKKITEYFSVAEEEKERRGMEDLSKATKTLLEMALEADGDYKPDHSSGSSSSSSSDQLGKVG